MDFGKYKRDLVQVAIKEGFEGFSVDWCGIDVLLPLIDIIREDGAVFLLKVDGERKSNVHTVAIKSGPLQDEGIRIDCRELEGGLAYAIVEYAKRVWGFQPD